MARGLGAIEFLHPVPGVLPFSRAVFRLKVTVCNPKKSEVGEFRKKFAWI